MVANLKKLKEPCCTAVWLRAGQDDPVAYSRGISKSTPEAAFYFSHMTRRIDKRYIIGLWPEIPPRWRGVWDGMEDEGETS